MNLDDVALFLSVAREQSFTRAARILEVPKSTISERIARLEKSLGVRLFDRTTRTLVLTDSGTEYLEHVRPLVEGIEDANAALTAAHQAPRGVLRVGAPLLVAQTFLAEMVADFLGRYPDIAVELVLQENASAFDLVHDRLDLAIHVFGNLDPNLVVRRLGATERIVVSSPAYVTERGAPKTPADLRDHSMVVVGASRKMHWTFGKGEASVDASVVGRYAVTSIDLVRRAVLHGVGIAVLPTFVCAEGLKSGALVRVLSDWTLPDAIVQVVYASGSRMSARTRAFADLLIERAREELANLPRTSLLKK